MKNFYIFLLILVWTGFQWITGQPQGFDSNAASNFDWNEPLHAVFGPRRPQRHNGPVIRRPRATWQG